jgi:hypothetical protein
MIACADGGAFASASDAALLDRLLAGDRLDGQPVRLRPCGSGCAPMLIRPGTNDAAAFRDVFIGKRNIPPVRLPRGARIVLLGCGVGYAAASFAWRDPECRVVGIENDASAAAIAGRNCARFGGRVLIVQSGPWSEVVLGELLDRLGAARVDYLRMDIGGAETVLLERPAPWLTRLASIRVHVADPSRVSWIESRLVEEAFIVRADPRLDRGVMAYTRAFAAAQPRYPKDADKIEEPPPPY